MSKFVRDNVIDNNERYSLVRIFKNGKSAGFSPLCEYLKSHDLLQYFSWSPWNFGDVRGYRCKWGIIDTKLYLVSFKSRSQRLNKTAQLTGEIPIEPYSEKRLINIKMGAAMRTLNLESYKKIGLKNSERKQIADLLDNLYEIVMQKKPLPQHDVKDDYNFPEDNTHLFAEWFSGELVLYSREAQNDEDLNGWHYVVENGIVVHKVQAYVKRPLV